MAKILVVDDEEGVRSFLAESLETGGHTVHQAGDGLEATRALEKIGFDLVITDLKMPRMDGMALLRWLRGTQPDVEVIVLTAYGAVDSAVEAMKLGAHDYLQKPPSSPDELCLMAERALERRVLRCHKANAQREQPPGPPISWGARSMQPVLKMLHRVAETTATVLLQGESGTGKEVAARAIHHWSSHAEGPFVAINCAVLSEHLLESELFGHEKGAFTGAHAQRRGRLELARGGTFFLDELGELPLPLQAKLLRVLETRQFERLGGNQTLEAEVRWIAATNRNLKAMVAAGTFREDLYHRVAVFPVLLPPLRDRREDIPALAQHILTEIGAGLGRRGLQLDPSALELLMTAEWKGNIRELRNVLERAAILAEDRVVRAEDLGLEDTQDGRVEDGDPRPGTLDELERRTIIQTLADLDGNRKQTADRLGIGLRTLYSKLRRYGIP